MGKDEMDVCRDLEYHGYPKTIEGLQNFERHYEKIVARKPLRNHFGAPCGFYKDDHKRARRILKRTRQKIKSFLEKEQTP